MKKSTDTGWRNVKYIIWIVFMLLIFIQSHNVHALGVAPSRDAIDYDQNDHLMSIRIINNENKDFNYLVYAQGELSKYVEILTTDSHVSSTEAEKEIRYKIKLPVGLTPGPNTLQIGIVEVPENSASKGVQQDEKTKIFSSVVVMHELVVNVPYPGKYADGYLYTTDGNINDTITFTAAIFNRGTDIINNLDGELIIKGPTNEELFRIKSNKISNVASKDTGKLVIPWIANVNTGMYYVEFIVNYDDKQLILRKTISIGSYYVDIKNIDVENFKIGAIAKMNVELVNKWNQPIKDVYGELFIIDSSGNVVSKVKTVSADLNPLISQKITGYWDTAGMKIGNYDVKTVIYYANKASERVFKAVVGIDSIKVESGQPTANVVVGGSSQTSGGFNSVLLALVIILVIINIGWFIYFKFMRKPT